MVECTKCLKLYHEEEFMEPGYCFKCCCKDNPSINHEVEIAYFTKDGWLVWKYKDGITCMIPPRYAGDSDHPIYDWATYRLDRRHINIVRRRQALKGGE